MPVVTPPKDALEIELEESSSHFYENIQNNQNIKIGQRLLHFTHIVLGEGHFGKVLKGELRREKEITPVAVKILKDQMNQTHRQDLLNEISSLKEVGRHDNIIQLMGSVINVPGLPDMIVMELVSGGSLLDLLTRSRHYYDHNSNEIKSGLQIYQINKFMYDIASGMNFLTSINVIHRDLAARNVLVANDGTLKLSDFGFSRNISNKGKYLKTSGGYFAIEWMAIKSLSYGLFNVQTDVWSYGVVAWEIFSPGDEPYKKLRGQMNIKGNIFYIQLIDRLKNGYRMEKPYLCSEEVCELMLACWNENPDHRPTFEEIRFKVNATLEKLRDGAADDEQPSPALVED